MEASSAFHRDNIISIYIILFRIKILHTSSDLLRDNNIITFLIARLVFADRPADWLAGSFGWLLPFSFSFSCQISRSL